MKDDMDFAKIEEQRNWLWERTAKLAEEFSDKFGNDSIIVAGFHDKDNEIDTALVMTTAEGEEEIALAELIERTAQDHVADQTGNVIEYDEDGVVVSG